MALNTKVFPNKVVMTTVSKAPIPNVAIDLCHMIIPGMVANNIESDQLLAIIRN